MIRLSVSEWKWQGTSYGYSPLPDAGGRDTCADRWVPAVQDALHFRGVATPVSEVAPVPSGARTVKPLFL